MLSHLQEVILCGVNDQPTKECLDLADGLDPRSPQAAALYGQFQRQQQGPILSLEEFWAVVNDQLQLRRAEEHNK